MSSQLGPAPGLARHLVVPWVTLVRHRHELVQRAQPAPVDRILSRAPRQRQNLSVEQNPDHVAVLARFQRAARPVRPPQPVPNLPRLHDHGGRHGRPLPLERPEDGEQRDDRRVVTAVQAQLLSRLTVRDIRRLVRQLP